MIFGLANFDNLTLSKMDPDCQKRAELSKMSRLSKPEILRSGHYVIKYYDKNIFDRGKTPLFEGAI